MPVPSPENIRILIVDSNRLVRAGLRMLIENHPGLLVSGEADSCNDASQLLIANQADVILFNLDANGGNQLDEVPYLLAATEQAHIILLTDELDPRLYSRAVSMGVRGVVAKTQSSDVLFNAIKRVQQGSVWLDRAMMASAITSLSREIKASKSNPELNKIASLTDREIQVIGLVCVGLKNKNIANQLFISQATVRHHLTSVFSKLEVSDRLELILYAFRNHLAEPPS